MGKKHHESNLLLTEPRPETFKLLTHLEKKNKSYFDMNRIEIESWSVILQMIQSGLGCGLVPDFLIKGNKHLSNIGEQLKIPHLQYETVCFYPHQKNLGFAAKKFLSLLKQSYKHAQ